MRLSLERPVMSAVMAVLIFLGLVCRRRPERRRRKAHRPRGQPAPTDRWVTGRRR